MTVSDDTLIEVQNLTNHTVGYISYDGKRRSFTGQAIMRIPANELRQLFYTRGGDILITEALSIKNRELAAEFGISDDSFDHEYNWTTQDVENLLLNDSLDALKDALDFAPEGIISTIVDKAVELKINDIAKRDAITQRTGRNITSMINWIELSQANESEQESAAPKTRRVKAAAEETKTRRVSE